MKSGKPVKKTDVRLWALIDDSIMHTMYIFTNHGKKRLKDRGITDLEVINILRNKQKRKRNKSKDKHEPHRIDWNYCIEGKDIDGNKIRIIISFNEYLMLIITVMHLHNGTQK